MLGVAPTAKPRLPKLHLFKALELKQITSLTIGDLPRGEFADQYRCHGGPYSMIRQLLGFVDLKKLDLDCLWDPASCQGKRPLEIFRSAGN